MNAAQALLALREHSDKVPDPIPPFLLAWEIPRAVARLRETALEDRQERSNQEWEDLLKAESEPVPAATLLVAWWNDRLAAQEKTAGEAEAAGDPYQSLTE